MDRSVTNERASSFQDVSRQWLIESCYERYSYRFEWMGRPIIQYPQDIMALQEIVWKVKPDLVIETGVAHGGSLVLYASLMLMNGIAGRVLGVDCEIREHNRQAITGHPMQPYISLLEGSSTDPAIVDQVRCFAETSECRMVVLDSNHTHDHVLKELELYSDLVTPGSYLIVLDTVVEDLPDELFRNRPWSRGNNPATAVTEFLNRPSCKFEVDRAIEEKLVVTVAPGGYLRRRDETAATNLGALDPAER